MIPTARPSLVQAPPAIPRGDTASRTVPFDYSFRFALDGIPRSVLRTTLTISVEASFTAVSIGYGVVPEVSPVIFGPRPAPVIFLAPAAGSRIRDITLGDLFDSLEAALSSTPDVPKGMPPLEAAQKGVFGIWTRGGLMTPLFEYVRSTLKTARPLRQTGFATSAVSPMWPIPSPATHVASASAMLRSARN